MRWKPPHMRSIVCTPLKCCGYQHILWRSSPLQAGIWNHRQFLPKQLFITGHIYCAAGRQDCGSSWGRSVSRTHHIIARRLGKFRSLPKGQTLGKQNNSPNVLFMLSNSDCFSRASHHLPTSILNLRLVDTAWMLPHPIKISLGI